MWRGERGDGWILRDGTAQCGGDAPLVFARVGLVPGRLRGGI